MEKLPVDFYLTGGTALSRVYLNHRYSDDLDFFVNQNTNFKKQVELIILSIKKRKIKTEIAEAGDSFSRLFVHENETILKIDFVNDIPYRTGIPVHTELFSKTDTITNILSNKITALSRYSEKDIVDLVYIALNYDFNWLNIFSEASEKDLWINPVEASKILDSFPLNKLDDIKWVIRSPEPEIFEKNLRILVGDLLTGRQNSLIRNNTIA
jgi:hypothetical protein